MFNKYDAWLVGYYGMQNCGDDALLLASISGLQRHLDCQKIAVSSVSDIRLNQNTAITKTLHTKQAWRGQNRLINYLNAFNSKRVIFGGGSVFHSVTDIQQKRHMMRLAGRGKSMALGVSLGPFCNVEAERACKSFLNECSFIGVRDKQSLEIAQSLAPNASVKLTFDLAVSLTKHPEFKINKGQRQGILFNVCPVSKDAFGNTSPVEEEQRARDLCHVIEALWRRTGERISLMCLNGNNQMGDISAINRVKKMLHSSVPISTIPYNSNPLKVLNVISHFKAMVSMRLHGNVFAYMSDTPSISLNYHPKCQQWCNQISLPGSMRFDASSLSKRRLFNVIAKGLEQGFPMARLPLETATELSELNWRKEDAKPQIFRRDPALQ